MNDPKLKVVSGMERSGFSRNLVPYTNDKHYISNSDY